MKKGIALCAILILAGIGYYYYTQKVEAKESAQKTADANLFVVEKGDIRITVSASGRVEPEREVEIKSKASGEVVEVFADVSDTVEQGMLLFRLDPTDEERSVAKLRASLAMSKAKLEQTRLGVKAAEARLEADTARAEADLKFAVAERDEYAARLRRSQQLYEQKVISREELDTAVTKGVQTETALANARVKLEDLKVQAVELERTRQEMPIAEAQVENDTVALADAEQRLKDTSVYSPITGVVSERSVQEGLIVASGVSNVGGGTTAMKLVDLSRVYAIAAVDEADIKGIQPGVKAIVTADAYKDMEFPGTVVRVATTGVVESNVVTFDVKVEVEGRNKALLKPEMTTNVTLLIDERADVLTIPAGAVVRKAPVVDRPAPAGQDGGRRNEGGGRTVDYTRRQSFVTVRTPDGKETERQVETGISDGYRVEVVSGLQPGETVVHADNGDSRWSGRAGGRGPSGPPPPR